MKKIAMILLITGIVTFLFAQAQHQPRVQELRSHQRTAERRAPEMEKHRSPEDYSMLEKLDLTDQQKEQIRVIRHNHQLEMVDLRAEVAKTRIEMREAAYNNNFREAKRLNDQLYSRKGEIGRKGIELRENIYMVLTEEQREQMKEMPRHRKRK